MRRPLLSALAAAVGAGCLAAASGCAGGETAPAEAAPGTPPEPSEVVEVQTAEALVDDLATVGAETVVLNVWATWCGPCVAEFPVLVGYAREQDSVAVRFVSVDDADSRGAVAAFLSEQGVRGPSYHFTGPGDLPSQLNPLFGGGAIPVTMVLDGEGIVQHTHVGAISREELTRAVAAARGGRS